MKLATVYVRRSSPVVIERSERVVFDGVAQRKVPQVIRYEVPQERVAELAGQVPARGSKQATLKNLAYVEHAVVGSNAEFTAVSLAGNNRPTVTLPIKMGNRRLLRIGYRDYTAGDNPHRQYFVEARCSCTRVSQVTVNDWRGRKGESCVTCGRSRSQRNNWVAPAADKTLPFHPKAGA